MCKSAGDNYIWGKFIDLADYIAEISAFCLFRSIGAPKIKYSYSTTD